MHLGDECGGDPAWELDFLYSRTALNLVYFLIWESLQKILCLDAHIGFGFVSALFSIADCNFQLDFLWVHSRVISHRVIVF